MLTSDRQPQKKKKYYTKNENDPIFSIEQIVYT